MNSAGGRGGRDRDKGRKYQSGSGKRKAKEERAAREKKVLSKMQKNSEMFSTKTSNSAVLETVDIVGGTHLADNLNPEIFKELEQNTLLTHRWELLQCQPQCCCSVSRKLDIY
jgi:hypothetical protein